MTLIADSGSTKTAWKWGGKIVETIGINPVRDSEEQIRAVLEGLVCQIENTEISKNFESIEGLEKIGSFGNLENFEISKGLPPTIREIHFYGAGCIPPYSDTLARLLRERFPTANILVESDMLGAARALCGRAEGIACILGTGSNSCLYDGERIVVNVSPLGYILGDEGSGAVLGRILVGEVLKGNSGLKEAFLARFQLTPALIIERVYRQPMPNRFLASLVPFLVEHRDEATIHSLLVEEFRRFFRRNVAHYRRPDLPVHFVGGVANQFASELREAAGLEGFRVGEILRNPIERMT